MSGKEFDPFSVLAWQTYSTREIKLDEQLSVKVRSYDILTLLAGENGKGNPLMSVIVQAMGSGADQQSIGKSLMQKPEMISSISKMLNETMVAVVVEPPLIESGSENGISVNEIPFDFKLKIFFELVGGQERLNMAAGFHEIEGSGVVAGPEE
jgi:hypothetical protein